MDFKGKVGILKALWINIFMSICLGTCVSPPGRQGAPAAIEPVHQNILLLDLPMSRFGDSGPFTVQSRFNRELTIDLDEAIILNHFAPVTADKAPVVVISHGNFSGKAAHREQSARLASWGFHVLSFEMPNRDQWLSNGRRLTRLLNLIHRNPELLGERVDADRMVVVGHSFGGSAAILAIAEGAPVIGGVLLDPAVVHSRVTRAMRSVNLPIVLLGADRKLFVARGRQNFSKKLGGEILEVTVPGAVHDDAQGPSMFSRSSLGVDPFTSRANQTYFAAMLTTAVIGLTSSGTVDFPRRLFGREQAAGRLKGLLYRNQSQHVR
jgi:dienelactone hydrolase